MSSIQTELLMKQALAAAQLAQDDAKRQLEAAASLVQEESETARVHGTLARQMVRKGQETAEHARIQCEKAAKQNLVEHHRQVAEAVEKGRRIVEREGELNWCPICKDSKPEVLFGCGHRFCHNCANRMKSCDSCGIIVHVRIVGQ